MKKLLVGGAAAAALTLAALPAQAWQPPTIEVQAAGCELADVSIHNPEEGPATITSSNYPVLQGLVIAGGGNVTRQISGTGTIHINVTVNFPDHADATADFTFTTCPRETTTTTVPEETTTTSEPVTTTSLHEDSSSESTGVTPHFTG